MASVRPYDHWVIVLHMKYLNPSGLYTTPFRVFEVRTYAAVEPELVAGADNIAVELFGIAQVRQMAALGRTEREQKNKERAKAFMRELAAENAGTCKIVE